jgi:hypothetical protein
MLIWLSSFIMVMAEPKPEPGMDVSKLLPPVQEFEAEIIQNNGKLIDKVRQTFKVDEQTDLINIGFISNSFEFKGSFTKMLRVKKSEFIFKSKDYIHYLGYEKRVTVWDDKTNQMRVQYYLNNRLKTTRYFSGAGIIDSDIVIFYLQGMLGQGIQELDNELVAKKDGLKIHVKFKLITTTDFLKLAPEYNFPENLQKLAGLTNETYVYVMEISGFTRLFYSSRYYYIFEKAPPHRVIAYWGGSLPDAEFGYIVTQ